MLLNPGQNKFAIEYTRAFAWVDCVPGMKKSRKIQRAAVIRVNIGASMYVFSFEKLHFIRKHLPLILENPLFLCNFRLKSKEK